MSKPSFRVVGLMAGSSHDGLDIALVRFYKPADTWQWELIDAQTHPYEEALLDALRESRGLPGEALLHLSISYTDWTARVLIRALRHMVYDLISWHPPTILHQPDRGLTWSLGDAERLSALTGRPVITHFRARDIALGGQGAPLIPHADAYLWPHYETLLNLGGIANITHLPTSKAFDIAPCNQLLNALAHQLTPPQPFDPEGCYAKQGRLLPELQALFEAAPFFHTLEQAALSNELVQTQFLDPFLAYPASPIDKLHTATHAIATKLQQVLHKLSARQVYLTGGGAHNTYLVQTLQAIAPCPCFLAPPALIDFREAIGFAFLGLRRYLGEDNITKFLTSAQAAHGGGSLSL